MDSKVISNIIDKTLMNSRVQIDNLIDKIILEIESNSDDICLNLQKENALSPILLEVMNCIQLDLETEVLRRNIKTTKAKRIHAISHSQL